MICYNTFLNIFVFINVCLNYKNLHIINNTRYSSLKYLIIAIIIINIISTTI